MLDLKYGTNNEMTNIFSALVDNEGFLKHQKFHNHKKYTIGIFAQINLKVTLRETLKERVQNVIMRIDIEDEQSKGILVNIKDAEENPTLGDEFSLISVIWDTQMYSWWIFVSFCDMGDLNLNLEFFFFNTVRFEVIWYIYIFIPYDCNIVPYTLFYITYTFITSPYITFI